VLDGGKEYDFRTSGITDLLGVSFDRKWLFDEHDSRHAALVENALKRNVVPLDGAGTAMLRQFWLMLSQILVREAEWPAGMPLELVAETALSNILLTLNMSCVQPSTMPVPASTRQGSVTQQAIRFMRARLADGISIDDVCAATHVSRRTLHNHFEKSLDMSPQQYLKVLRLNLARSRLRDLARHGDRSYRQRNIAEIAAQCGYDHASRFAGDYKRQFGVLPSETLRESARRGLLEA
jgi:AraC family ethanolamine operon transcriptional activator